MLRSHQEICRSARERLKAQSEGAVPPWTGLKLETDIKRATTQYNPMEGSHENGAINSAEQAATKGQDRRDARQAFASVLSKAGLRSLQSIL